MEYSTELTFLQNVLSKLNIQSALLRKDRYPEKVLDLGIRELLCRKEEYRRFIEKLPWEIGPKTIYKHTDPYLCNYFFVPLSDAEATLLLIGPYMSLSLTHDQLLMEAERLSLPPGLFNDLEGYYGGIPVLREEGFLFSLLYTFAEMIWGDDRSYSVVNLTDEWTQSTASTLENDHLSLEKTKLNMNEMERRYAFENELLRSVTLGLTQKAEMMLSTINQIFFKQRVSDPLRNIKNYSIIMNTLMRKAAEKGSVHPLYLDKISSEFALKIELTKSTTDGYKLMLEMVCAYCRLVNKHSMANYSLPIHKTLVCIDANLASDLSLHALAATLNVSPGYLSSLFAKEVGTTLTEYVTRKKMDQARRLLRGTVLQIQTISQYCGFQDLNYFSKTFKRYNHCTPTKFRANQNTENDGIL